MTVNAIRALTAMADSPVRCAGAACPSEQWVIVTDATWRCDQALVVDGPYRYVPIAQPGARALLAAVQEDRTPCFKVAQAPAQGIIKLSASRGPLAAALDRPTHVLWLGHGPRNSKGVAGIGAAFMAFGIACVWFYRARLRRS